MDNDFIKFETYVHDLQRFKNTNAYSWCKERQNITNDSLNKKKILLKEINQFDFQVRLIFKKDPFKLISNGYKNRLYNKDLFEEELNLINNKSYDLSYIQLLIDKCEHNERIRTIIENYLTYIVELNFESIIISLSKLNIIESNVIETLVLTKESKNKITSYKKNYLNVNSRFLLKKQRLKNIIYLRNISKIKLLTWKGNLEEITKSLSMNQLHESYLKLTTMAEDMKKSSYLNSLTTYSILYQSNREKTKFLFLNADKMFGNIFLARNHNYKDLFIFNILTCNLDEYLNKFMHIFKDTVFLVIKETFYSFSDDKFISKEDIKKVKDLNKFIKMDESKFIQCINQTIQNLIKICENYIFYNEIHKKLSFDNENLIKINTKFTQDIENNKKRIYEIVEKKLTKLYIIFKQIIKEFSTKNIIYFSFFNSISLDYFNHLFDVNYSKHLKLQIKTLVSENLKVQNLNTIKKISILLEGDAWNRVTLPNDSRCFEIEKLKEMVPESLRSCINIFNEDDYLTKNNIRGLFSRLIDINIYLTNSLCFENIPIKELILIFKDVKMEKMMISSSTYNMLKSFNIFVMFYNYFNSITFDIFMQLFNTVDFFMICSMRMLLNKSQLKRLYEEFNSEELKKRFNNIFANKIEGIVDTLFFQKSNVNLKAFIEKSKRLIESNFMCKLNLFENNDESNDNDDSNFNEFQLPRLNSKLFNDNNSYYLMIESIVWFESLKSIVRILKKMQVFITNIQLDFQKNSIMEIIKKYRTILKELQVFVYKPLCENIFKVNIFFNKFDNVIMNKVLSVKWDQNDSDIDTMFTEANSFVNLIFSEICEKYEKLDILSKYTLSNKSKKRFLKVIMIYIQEKLMETFSKIKKCSTFGRSIMLKDLKFLKSKVETKFGTNEFNEIFNFIDNYINSWYSNENELICYIKEKQINYKYLAGILNTGPCFIKLSKQQKKDYQSKLEEVYLQLLDN